LIEVNKLYALSQKANLPDMFEVCGLLICKRNSSIVIDSKERNNIEYASSLYIDHKDLNYALISQIPIQHGTDILFFQNVVIVGTVDNNEKRELFIRPESITVIDNYTYEHVAIDFSETVIKKGKERWKDVSLF